MCNHEKWSLSPMHSVERTYALIFGERSVEGVVDVPKTITYRKTSVKPFNYPVLKHGRLYYSYRGYFPVLVNQQFLYKCDQYFVPPSQHSWDYLTCTAEGWSPEESCLRECFFNNLGNRYTPSSEKKCLQGETVRVRCYEGYSLQNNQNTMTCTESGWSPPPRCIRVKSCDRPVFENTRAKSDGTWFRLNDRLDYECLNGYENRDGHTTVSIVCGQDGWSNKAACYGKCSLCGPPPPIDNGDITSLLQSVNPPGMIVEYQCQAYYELRGDRNVVCQNGEWSEPPKCLETCVISEETMRKHHIQLRWRHDTKLYSKTEDNIEFMCQRGYRPVTPEHTF
ncbi:TPA: Cfh protein-like [Bos taurus]|nr:TPA: Cfh protein-like [Bos taurus]